MNQQLFRKVALDRLSSPEQLDEMMTVTTPKGWFLLIAVGLFVAMSLIWLFFGSISEKVSGQGIIASSTGVFNISSYGQGQVSSIEVDPGDFIKKGELVAVVSDPDISLSLKQARNELGTVTSQNEFALKNSQINLLEMKEKQSSKISSPVSGTVLEVKVTPGEFIKPGQSIISVSMADPATDDVSSEVILYIPAEEGKRIQPDMDVQITPASVKREEYGYILGKVRSISGFPVTSEAMGRTLGSKELIQKFLSGNATVMELRVTLLKDNSTPSGYLWSSRQGVPGKVGEGTICSAQVVVSKKRPITLFILKIEDLLRKVVAS